MTTSAATAARPPLFPLSVYLLAAAQGLAGSIPPIMVSLGGMVGHTLTDRELLVTLPVSMFMVGTAVATVPVAALMRRFGRKPVYLGGALVAALGGSVCVLGVLYASFALFCVGSLLFGLNIACVQSYRFAAGTVVEPAMRARAISFVLAGGLVSAVLGPQIVVWTSTVVLGAPFAMSFLAQSFLAVATLPFLALTRLPAIGQKLARHGAASHEEAVPSIASYVLAVICGAVTYASMSFTMTAAPLAMIACGFGVQDAALGIQWHILGMFGPSFITGRLIERFGHFQIMLLGMALVAVGSLISLQGQELGHFWATLILLGVGWNFGFTGSTVMIARCATGPKAVLLQGIADLAIFAFVAVSSLMSGVVIHGFGWNVVQWVVLVSLACVAAIIVVQRRKERLAA